MTSHQAPRQDVYSRVTATIIASLEAGVRPWQKPWNDVHAAGHITRPLRANGQPYRGVNVLLLWSEAEAKGYNAPIWMTYKQAATMGAQVRKGEHGSLVVYADKFTKTETDGEGHETERAIPFMKGYTVFNVEQVDGLPAHFHAKAEAPQPVERIPQAEAFFAATGATLQHGGNRAFYAPSRDLVQMPPRESFKDAESYVATLAHELTHWTAHPSRRARELGKRFGDQAYAAEELIAELGSAFLCADLGITPEVRADHASYLTHWLDVLKRDSHAIFTMCCLRRRGRSRATFWRCPTPGGRHTTAPRRGFRKPALKLGHDSWGCRSCGRRIGDQRMLVCLVCLACSGRASKAWLHALLVQKDIRIMTAPQFGQTRSCLCPKLGLHCARCE